MCVATGFKTAVEIQMRRAGRDLNIPREGERKGRKRSRDSLLRTSLGVGRGHEHDSGDRFLSLLRSHLTFPPREIASFNKPEQIIQAILQRAKGRVSRPAEESGLQCADGDRLSAESHYQTAFVK